MSGRKLYITFLVSMALLAAFGAWVAVDSAAAYKQRPVLQDQARPGYSLTYHEDNRTGVVL